MTCSSDCTKKLLGLLRSIQGSFKKIACDFDLSLPEMMIIYELYDNKTLTLNQLSEKIDLPKSSVSRVVDQLVNKGIILREIPEENRRTVKLSISPEYLETSEFSNIRQKLDETVLGDIEQEKTNRLTSVLDELGSLLKCDKNNNKTSKSK